MKLEMARTLGLVAALSALALAMVAWNEPAPQVLSAQAAMDYCPLPPSARVGQPVEADKDLLLFMFGLSQGMGKQS